MVVLLRLLLVAGLWPWRCDGGAGAPPPGGRRGVADLVLGSGSDGMFSLYDADGRNSVLCASQLCFAWAAYAAAHVRQEARLAGVGAAAPRVPGATVALRMWHHDARHDTLVATDAALDGSAAVAAAAGYELRETLGTVYAVGAGLPPPPPHTVPLELWHSAARGDHATLATAAGRAEAVAAGYAKLATLGHVWPAPGASGTSRQLALNHDGRVRAMHFEPGDNLTAIADAFITEHNVVAAACCLRADLACVRYHLARAMALQLQPFQSWRHSPLEVTHRWRRASRALDPVPATPGGGANATAPARYDGQLAEWYRVRGDNTLRHDYTLDRHEEAPAPATVFVVGGHNGSYARSLFDSCHRRCRIFVFEPVPEFAAAAADGLRRISDDARWPGSITVLPWGLAAHDGEVDFVFEGLSTSQFLPRHGGGDGGGDGGGGGGGGERRVLRAAVRTLASAMHELRVHHLDLLMVNCEGCEYELLPHLIGAGLLPHIDNLQIQFHCRPDMGFTGREQLLKLYSLLVPTHELSWNYTCIWENWRRV